MYRTCNRNRPNRTYGNYRTYPTEHTGITERSGPNLPTELWPNLLTELWPNLLTEPVRRTGSKHVNQTGTEPVSQT